MKWLQSIFLLILFKSILINADDVEFEIKSNIMLKMLREMVNQTSAADSLNLPANASSIRENISDTFSCENRTYGYYADVDNDCQVFHVCLPTQSSSGRNVTYRWSFICPNETIFNQEVLVCTRPIDSIPCEESPMYYYMNNDIGKLPNNTKTNETNTQSNQQNTQGYPQSNTGYQQTNQQNTQGYPQSNTGYQQSNQQNTQGYPQSNTGYQQTNQQNTQGYPQSNTGYQQTNQQNPQGYPQSNTGYQQTNQQNTQGYQQTNQQNPQGYQQTNTDYQQTGYQQANTGAYTQRNPQNTHSNSQKPTRRRPGHNKQNYTYEKLMSEIVNKEMQDKVEDFGIQNDNVENIFPMIDVPSEFEPSGLVNKDKLIIDDDRLIMERSLSRKDLLRFRGNV